MDQSADYVVAGAGSAGCVLARRLAESGASVILLEAGGPDRTRLVRKPGMIAIFHNVPALKKRLDWGYYTVPQAAARGRRIPQPRGWVLGGSGSINGMLFVRGNQKNYDDWAAAGCKGWSFADVLPSFKRMEDWEGGASDAARRGGPIKVTRQQDLTPAAEAFLAALAETAGVPRIDDYNGESQEGASIFQQNVSGGLRYSSSVGYLDDHGLPGLTVWTGAQVQRVVIEGNRAVGVEVITAVRARDDPGGREVILSAGVFGSAAAADAVRRRPGRAPARARHRRRRRPAGGRQPARPHVRADDLRDEDGPQPRHHPVLRGRGDEGGDPGRHLDGPHRVRGGRLRPQRPGRRDPRHPAPGAAVVLPVPEPGRAHQAQGRQAAGPDDHDDADLPAAAAAPSGSPPPTRPRPRSSTRAT